MMLWSREKLPNLKLQPCEIVFFVGLITCCDMPLFGMLIVSVFVAGVGTQRVHFPWPVPHEAPCAAGDPFGSSYLSGRGRRHLHQLGFRPTATSVLPPLSPPITVAPSRKSHIDLGCDLHPVAPSDYQSPKTSSRCSIGFI